MSHGARHPKCSHNGELYKGSLASRIAEFFKMNPDEELTFDDAAAKFNANKRHLSTVLNLRKEFIGLEVVHVIRMKKDGGYDLVAPIPVGRVNGTPRIPPPPPREPVDEPRGGNRVVAKGTLRPNVARKVR